jgi:hypothetical protein
VLARARIKGLPQGRSHDDRFVSVADLAYYLARVRRDAVRPGIAMALRNGRR